ncbi:MAG: hypothetical protein OXN16_10260 [Gammaproteobacteria bacterium]|nr:hypothetical protein [Gammaproteobacteria bacterium]
MDEQSTNPLDEKSIDWFLENFDDFVEIMANIRDELSSIRSALGGPTPDYLNSVIPPANPD